MAYLRKKSFTQKNIIFSYSNTFTRIKFEIPQANSNDTCKILYTLRQRRGDADGLSAFHEETCYVAAEHADLVGTNNRGQLPVDQQRVKMWIRGHLVDDY